MPGPHIDVVALPLEDEAAHGKFDTEPALHEQQYRRTAFVALPAGALFAAGVDPPLDLHPFGSPDVVVHKVANDPAAVLFAIVGRIAGVPMSLRS